MVAPCGAFCAGDGFGVDCPALCDGWDGDGLFGVVTTASGQGTRTNGPHMGPPANALINATMNTRARITITI